MHHGRDFSAVVCPNHGVRVRECVHVGNLVRDGVLVREFDGVNVRGLVGDGVKLRVGVRERVNDGV
jgi:hypothetical protein